MHKTIEISLSEASIDNAIKEFDAFRQWIEQKTEELNERLARLGRDFADNAFNAAMYDGDDREVQVLAEPTDDGWLVTANGHAVAFIEFGAGVFYNAGNTYPGTKPPEVSPIGTYGKGYGARRGWKYRDSTGELVFTRGNPAAAPMFYATQEIIKELNAIAQEVFA